jgi:probable selenate reductase FAD-binding subunit
MPKKPGAYHRPKNLSEALQLLAQPGSVALAGGTKLLASEAGLPADHVIDLQSLGLDQIEADEDILNIGATCTLSDLAAALARENPSEPASVFLQEAIHSEGPNTYRNAATVGGSIASRLPDSELLAALLVLDAHLIFAKGSDSEGISLAAYLEAGDPQQGLITSVQIPWAHGRGAAERVARTPADYPIVSITVWYPSGGPVRLAATGIGPYPERLYAAENVLSGELDAATVDAAAMVVKENVHHPGDFRGDTAYRAQMAEVLTRRVLQALSQ